MLGASPGDISSRLRSRRRLPDWAIRYRLEGEDVCDFVFSGDGAPSFTADIQTGSGLFTGDEPLCSPSSFP